MTILMQTLRVSLLTLGLAASGCFLSTDDDTPTGDTGGSVTVTADLQACHTKCDKARTDCSVSCSDNVCTGACDSKKQTCYTDCD